MEVKKMQKEEKLIKVRIEHLSFESCGEYMDVIAHTDYVDITIGGEENAKFPVTLEDWEIIDVEVRKLLKQK